MFHRRVCSSPAPPSTTSNTAFGIRLRAARRRSATLWARVILIRDGPPSGRATVPAPQPCPARVSIDYGGRAEVRSAAVVRPDKIPAYDATDAPPRDPCSRSQARAHHTWARSS
ncbi:hypothetical protein GCM10010472_37440 [Pseudonocardia halophobica]|uniref:Uncharacterized protein n=1 Tax=Pseudonocardia halophobica TaxID=29401 RepID=A0A9W6L706_9PSEU|nr:hypothetical protein GCM10017577_52160 [Pseudonocardia halophobica]